MPNIMLFNKCYQFLNDIVRLLRGTTVKKMISQRLILEAKRELSFGALTVKEIAFKLGFRDASYFSRFFKKHTGQNPDGFKFGNT